jgi:catechol 2,3-dioxygenase-like lactoylglutathione lyase family enzyme
VPEFPSFSHYALTVRDLDRSIAFYEKLVGAPPPVVGEETTYRFALWLEPTIVLHQHQQASDVPAFSELRIGLDHIAFGCADRDELQRWKARLDELGIERGDIVEAPYGAGLAFRDPDGIQLEFFVEGPAH